MNTIELKKLSFHWHENEPLLNELSLTMTSERPVLIVGKTGCGKSTLLQILAALRRPGSGECLVNGEPVSRWNAPFRDNWRKKVGILPQKPLLMEDDSVFENVMLPILNRSYSLDQVIQLAKKPIEQLNLSHCKSLPVSKLSGGEAQRAGLARAVVAQPEFLFLDEPSSHQDRHSLETVMAVLAEVQNRGGLVVAVTHDERLIQHPFFEHKLSLEQGCLRAI